MVSIPDSGVARTWFGFHYQEQDQESQYYSFNVMHINSLWKDHGLLTQLHGSFKDYAFWDFNFGQEFQQKTPNFYSRLKTIKGKRSTTGCMIVKKYGTLHQYYQHLFYNVDNQSPKH